VWYNPPVARKEVLTYKQLSELTYEELFRKAKEMLKQEQRLVNWFNAAARVDLLPILQALHDQVAQPGRRGEPDPNKPNWEQVCRLLGITPELVRQWKRRTQTDTDIRHLLGEEDNKPGTRVEDKNALATKHLQQLCSLVLSGDDIQAERLATAIVERYGF
jgi:transposase-like protein